MSKHTEKLELINIDKLIPYANNARTHSDDQIKKIQASIREFGFVNPVLIDKDYGIIAGHGRVEAAKREGMTEVPCVWVEHLAEAQKKAYILADNRLALDAGWDFKLLSVELEELKELDFDIGLTGFGADELSDIFGEEELEAVEDDYEVELPEEPKTKLGDIYQLGRHRLLCGDSTDKATVDKLMDGKKADMAFTDPPYGVNRDKGFGGERAFGGGTGNKIKSRVYDGEWDNETPPQEAFDNLLENSKEAIVWGGNFFTDKLPVSGFWLVWDKHQTMPTFGDCELAWTNIPRKSVKKYDVVYNGLIGKEKERFHPTQKPVKLCADVLSDLTEENALVLDLFGGSGSTLIACEQLNRNCYMMELDPKYCDVIINRWETLTGEKAVKL